MCGYCIERVCLGVWGGGGGGCGWRKEEMFSFVPWAE